MLFQSRNCRPYRHRPYREAGDVNEQTLQMNKPRVKRWYNNSERLSCRKHSNPSFNAAELHPNDQTSVGRLHQWFPLLKSNGTTNSDIKFDVSNYRTSDFVSSNRTSDHRMRDHDAPGFTISSNEYPISFDLSPMVFLTSGVTSHHRKTFKKGDPIASAASVCSSCSSSSSTSLSTRATTSDKNHRSKRSQSRFANPLFMRSPEPCTIPLPCWTPNL